MNKQKTIKDRVVLKGVGLHSGQKTNIEFLPASCNSAIFFIRKDLSPEVMIKADYDSVLDPSKFPRRTSVDSNGVYVHTIEHLMAAINLLAIDNLQINIWGEEIPGMDGSAKCFVEALKEAQIIEQNSSRKFVVIREPLWVEDKGGSLAVFPYPSLRVSYTLKYDTPLISTGYIDLVLNGTLQNDIYEARTFCLEEEVKPLLELGLGKGSNYGNTLVVAKDRIIDNSLRIKDEFVKHKVLDLLGDLYLAGPMKGYVVAIKSGHALNIKMVRKIKEYHDKVVSGGIGSSLGYMPNSSELSIEDIMKILPHRYPFLLIDRIIDLKLGEKAVGIKNVTINDYFFTGHFPGRPIMPGVLIVEAMAQVGGVLMLASEKNRGKLAYFMAADKVKFRRTVEPGDQLVIEVVSGKIKTRTGIVHTKAFVNGKTVAEAELMFALVES